MTGRAGDDHSPPMTNPMAILRRRPFGLMAAVLLALTASMLGFAHKPVVVAPAAFISVAQVLPDGTPLDLCHSDVDVDGAGVPTGHDSRAAVCDACLLSGSPGSGAIAATVVEPVGDHVIATVTIDDQVVVGRSPLAAASRGPPASV